MPQGYYKNGEKFIPPSRKGTKLSEKQKENISASLRGKMPKNIDILHSKENRLKAAMALRGRPFSGIKCDWNGRKHSNKTKLKMSASRMGKKMPLEVRKKLSNSVAGEKSTFWRGGLTDINLKIRHGIEYRLWREAVFARDN